MRAHATSTHTTSTHADASRPASRPTRRTVLTAAAWSAPAVALASAAPAYATSTGEVSPPPAALALTPVPTGTWTSRDGFAQHMTGQVTVRNHGTAAAQGLRVTVTVPNSYVRNALGGNASISVTNLTPGWTASSVTYTGSGQNRIGAFTLTAAAPLAANGSTTLSYRVNLVARLLSGFTGPIAVSATSSTHTHASTSFVPTL